MFRASVNLESFAVRQTKFAKQIAFNWNIRILKGSPLCRRACPSDDTKSRTRASYGTALVDAAVLSTAFYETIKV